MTPVVVAFGSNLGDREQNIARAFSLLESLMVVQEVSGNYETDPMYVTDQPPFLNGVVVGLTDVGPINFVKGLKEIENKIGRVRRTTNGPREIDLDLIQFGQLVLESNGSVKIVVPHPRLAERRFVLEPFFEVAPDAFLPRLGFVESMLHREEVQCQSARRVADARVPVPSA